MDEAPIRILGWDEGNHCWQAARAGESSFAGVQDLDDLYAAALSRRCDIVMSDEVWIEMNGGFSPIRPSDVHRP
jgi:hypothetical protein